MDTDCLTESSSGLRISAEDNGTVTPTRFGSGQILLSSDSLPVIRVFRVQHLFGRQTGR